MYMMISLRQREIKLDMPNECPLRHAKATARRCKEGTMLDKKIRKERERKGKEMRDTIKDEEMQRNVETD